MKFAFALVTIMPLASLILACSPAPGPQQRSVEEVIAARSIEGEYVVTFVNEAVPLINIEDHEPTITIDAERIHFQSQCIYHDWAYERDAERLQTRPWTYPESGGVVGMCARGLSAGETAIIEAVGGADTIRFVPRGLWLTGDGGTLQMRFVPSDDQLAARDVDLTGSWNAQALDGSDLPVGIDLEASFDAIWWEPGCAGQGISYTIQGERFSAPEPGNPGMVCDIGFPPELTAIWSAMSEADTIEQTVNNGVLISGNGRSVLLAPNRGEAR
ncbi:hypothetical protein [Aurantiacibacter marinus]|uniref:DUF306 domain-containing protein n=1 Tax=Aurantiacibacter marinus TaxID=874156 RepID=A0A0H0XXC4_9SPHN|nr:hypothetical protein [Aurantiacibacter marinus]KLI64935.1 hypothetical protein AAV99_05425 [Aurantiacibacter marinus]